MVARPASSLRARVAAALAAAAALSAPAAGQAGAEWTSLDEEVELLTRSLAGPRPIEIEAFMKLTYRRSDDAPFTRDPQTLEERGDLGGFGLESAGISIAAERGGVRGEVGYNPVTRRLRSTFVALQPAPFATVTLGRFKAPFLRSRLVSISRMLFIDRTIQAQETGPRDEGVELVLAPAAGVELALAAQNGRDSSGDETTYRARLEVDAVGGGVGPYEGAYGAPSTAALTLGLSFARDEALGDGRFAALDLAFTRGRASLAAEIVRYPGDEPDLAARENVYGSGVVDPLSLIAWADTRPWALTASWLLVEDAWEGALRWEELDDTNDTARLSVGLNRYVEGHDVKWQLNFVEVRTDDAPLRSQVLALGLVVGF